MRFLRLLLLIFPLLIVGNNVGAQELTPIFENITDGLPSTEVHDMFQDTLGFIWFATDRGICRFDGENMKKIDTEKYINSNVFFKFFKESETKIWLLSDDYSQHSFNPYDARPRFLAHTKNAQIKECISSMSFGKQISGASFSGKDMFLLFRFSSGYLLIPGKGKCRLVEPQNELYKSPEKIAALEFKQVNNSYYTRLLTNPGGDRTDILDLNGKQSISLENIMKYGDFGVSTQLVTKSATYLSVENLLIRIHHNVLTVQKMPAKILCLLERDEKIYVGTYDGIFLCDKKMLITAHFLKSRCVTKMMLDKNGFFWATTTNYGIYLSENLSINELKFDFEFNTTNFLNTRNSLLLFDDRKRQGLFIDDQFLVLKKPLDLSIVGTQLFFDNPEIHPFLNSFQPIKWTKTVGQARSWRYYSLSSNQPNTYFVTAGKIVYESNGGTIPYPPARRFSEVTFCEDIGNKRLLIGSKTGLRILDTNSKQTIDLKNELRFESAIVLSGIVVMASNDGIYYFSNNKLHRLEGTKEFRPKSILKRSESQAWVRNDNSIFKLNLHDGKPKLVNKPFYTTSKTTIILEIYEYANHLLVSTKKEMQLIDLKSYKYSDPSSTSTFLIDSLIVGSKKWDMKLPISILEKNTLSLHFSYIRFNQSISRDIEYSINGQHWFETNKQSILLSGLSEGDYVLKIRMAEEPSNILCSIPIHVSKIWYETYWFIAICCILILGLIILLGYRFYKSRHDKTTIELEKLHLELKLLTSKMNPHFTFNTINSIQYFILKSKKEEAIQYLSDFALLIRKSLEFSMAEQIKVEDELDFLALYVKLENRRFDSNFSLQLDYDPEKLKHKKIPSMLIQPLVENIILHAGYSEEDSKLIHVTIRNENALFTIIVRDNGKGIVPKTDLMKHKSYGIDILRSRVKIYNGKEFIDSDVELMSNSNGTTVTIKLKEWI